jgi:primosomal protein N'
MDLRETDVDARILAYFQRFAEIVLEHGLEEVFSGPDGEAEKCKRLVACLAPPVLKEDVKNAVRWTKKDAGKSIQKLYTLVYEKAVEHERHFQQNKRMRVMAKDKPAPSKPAKNAGKAPMQASKPARANFGRKLAQQKSERNVEQKTDSKTSKQPFRARSRRRHAPSARRCTGSATARRRPMPRRWF